MKNKIFGSWTDGEKVIDVNLQVIIFTEDKTHIVYCPALNLTGYGETVPQAEESFRIVLNEYFNYTSNKKTLAEDLKDMGWKIRKDMKKPATPPTMSELLQQNDEFRNIFDNYDYKKVSTSIRMPILV